MLESSLKKRLRNLAAEYETRDFFAGGRDPSAFMREVFERGGSDANKEATAFVASCLSFGSISQFVPKIRSLVEFARDDMAEWICSGAFVRDIPADSECKFYRFVSYGNLLAFFKTYSRLMRKWGTLGNYVRENCDGTGLGAVKAICAAFADSGSGSLVPVDATSACKRLCMFLRWMTRSDSPVDLGLWSDFIDRRTLIMPLDTHVLKESAALGLVTPGQSSMRTAIRLTAAMAEVFPDDPLKGDFALFGHGVAKARAAPCICGEQDLAPAVVRLHCAEKAVRQDTTSWPAWRG